MNLTFKRFKGMSALRHILSYPSPGMRIKERPPTLAPYPNHSRKRLTEDGSAPTIEIAVKHPNTNHDDELFYVGRGGRT